jgi:hypothetical protein
MGSQSRTPNSKRAERAATAVEYSIVGGRKKLTAVENTKNQETAQLNATWKKKLHQSCQSQWVAIERETVVEKPMQLRPPVRESEN